MGQPYGVPAMGEAAVKTTFHINHGPPKVGSFMRNGGNGQRIMQVIAIKHGEHEDTITMRSYGCTNKGDFAPAVKPRNITGNVSHDRPSSVIVTQGSHGYGWAHYYHVNRKDVA